MDSRGQLCLGLWVPWVGGADWAAARPPLLDPPKVGLGRLGAHAQGHQARHPGQPTPTRPSCEVHSSARADASRVFIAWELAAAQAPSPGRSSGDGGPRGSGGRRPWGASCHLGPQLRLAWLGQSQSSGPELVRGKPHHFGHLPCGSRDRCYRQWA